MKEKLSWREAEAVVRAFRAENGMSSDVEVSTLAATLGTTSAEIRRLAGGRCRFVDRSGVLSAALALGVVGILALRFSPSSASTTTVLGTSRFHAVPKKPERLVVIDLATGRELPAYPAGRPAAPIVKTL